MPLQIIDNLLQLRNLRNPVLSVLEINQTLYHSLILQPKGEILATVNGINSTAASSLFAKCNNFIDLAGQVTGQVSAEVGRLLKSLQGEMTRQELQEKLELKGRANFEERYLRPAIEHGLIEYTIPDKPNSRLQKYRLTKKGAEYLKKQGKK